MTMDNDRACELGKVRSLRTKGKVKNGSVPDGGDILSYVERAGKNESERMNERR